MSVDAVRRLVEGRGCCGVGVTVASVLVAAMFIFSSNCMNGKSQGDQGGRQGTPLIAKVAGQDVFAPQDADKSDNESALLDSLDRSIHAPFWAQFAEKQGLKPTDAEIVASALNVELFQFKQEMNLPPTASDAEVSAALQNQTGQTLQAISAQLLAALKSPESRLDIEAMGLPPLLLKQIAATINPTDDQVKAQFDSFTLRRIFLKAPDAGIDDSAGKAQKALDVIKAGLSFQAAMNRYSNDPAPPGKTVGEATTSEPKSALLADANMSVLADLKPGQMSGVVAVPGGSAIYQVVSIKSVAPPDFQTNQKRYRQSLAASMAGAQIRDAVVQFDKNPKIEWKSKGYEALWDLGRAMLIRDSNEAQKKALKHVEDEAANIPAEDPGQRVAALVRLAAANALWASATPAEQKDMAEDRADAISQWLTMTEDPMLRLQLADLLMQLKRGDQAADAVLEAARDNLDTDAKGQALYESASSMEAKLKKAGLLKPEAMKAIDDELSRWRQDRVESQKALAEQKKRDAEDALANEKEKKRLAEEDKKRAASSTAPAPTIGLKPPSK